MSRRVELRRYNTSQPWGFKMQGGTDVGMPLFVAHVSPNSVAGQTGLKAGDAILQIGNVDVVGFTHEQARGEMLRNGNEVDLTVQSGLINPPEGSVVEEDRPRMSVSDSDSPYQDVTSKTFKMLESKELPDAEASGLRPASIFDKKRQNRSAYTTTDKSGYTKPFGQQ